MTDRERIAARLTVLARILGWEGPDAIITAAGIDRVHAGWVQRSAGAWSWGTTGRLSMGSQSPMRECVRAAWVVSVIVDQYAIDPVGKNDAPPAGASFGVNPPWGRSSAHIQWYDAEGNPVAVPATCGTVAAPPMSRPARRTLATRSARRSSRTTPARKRKVSTRRKVAHRNPSHDAIRWARNYSYPTVYAADVGGARVTITMVPGGRLTGARPFETPGYELAIDGKVVGVYDSRDAAAAVAATLLTGDVEQIPDPPRNPVIEAASTTMGAALLSGDPTALVTKETVKSEREWSQYQRDIFDFIRDGTGNAIVEAVSGSGKTSTIMESLKYIDPARPVLILAFNKAIEIELKERVPPGRNVEIRTLTAFGYDILKPHWTVRYDETKSKWRDFAVIREAVGNDDLDRINYLGATKFLGNLSTLVGLCQSYLAITRTDITAIQNDHQVLVAKETGMAEDWMAVVPKRGDKPGVAYTHANIIQWVQRALRLQLVEPKQGGAASFRDMIYVPAMNPTWKSPKLYDFVFVDETQDTDAAQLSLVVRAVRRGGRIICVGDRRQCVARDTLVTTPAGPVRADALAVGDAVVVYRNGRNEAQPVLAVSVPEEKACVRIHTVGGRSLTMSLEHRIWATAPKDHAPGVSLLAHGPEGSVVSIDGVNDPVLFAHNRAAEDHAELVAARLGLPVRYGLCLDGRAPLEILPAADLRVRMDVAVEADGDGTAATDTIDRIESCRAEVLDIEAGTANNFYGNSILSHNSIYRFRGADDEAIPRMTKVLGARVLPLSVSYRVTRCSAAEARKIVPTFEVPDDATPGICEEVDAVKMMRMWDVGDIVISRKNAVMTPLALIALRGRKLPYIMGDDDQIPALLKGTLKDVLRAMGPAQGIDAFAEYLRQWADKERKRFVEKFVARRKEIKWRGDPEEGVEDEMEFLQIGIIENAFWNAELTGISQLEFIKSVGDIHDFIALIAPSESQIAKLDPEKFRKLRESRIIFTSAHRIKGGEGRRIFLLEETFNWSRKGLSTKRPLSQKELIQEQNLWYVAVTRVMHQRANAARGIPAREGELYYVKALEDAIGTFRRDGLK